MPFSRLLVADRRCSRTAALGWRSALAAHFLLPRAEWHWLLWVARENWVGGTSGWAPEHSLPHPSSPPTPQPKSENALNREKHSTACLAQICATFVSAKFKPLSLQCFHSCQQRRRPLAAAKLWIEPRRGRGRERTTKKEGSKTAEI